LHAVVYRTEYVVMNLIIEMTLSAYVLIRTGCDLWKWGTRRYIRRRGLRWIDSDHSKCSYCQQKRIENLRRVRAMDETEND
jgi:hypothetical protein